MQLPVSNIPFAYAFSTIKDQYHLLNKFYYCSI